MHSIQKWLVSSFMVLSLTATTWAVAPQAPIVGNDIVFEEVDGLVAVEAEYFYKQTKSAHRQWYRHSADDQPNAGRDTDPPHVYGASNNAYLEILPDTRKDHGEKLINGENFAPQAGTMGLLHYKVYFNTPGRYYVWVRAHSTGSEDNGLHVGIDGTWPATGQRLQWCEGKRTWRWESKQRTEKQHCGEPYKIYLDVGIGLHEITFSMREDGFEFDKWFMTKARDFQRPTDDGPAVRIKRGPLPKPFPVVPQPPAAAPAAVSAPKKVDAKIMKAIDFPVDGTNFYVNNTWLAINPDEHKQAETRMPFPYAAGRYDVVFYAVGENDGCSQFRVLRNDEEIGHFICPLSGKMYEEGRPYNTLWENVQISKGDAMAVEARVGTDGQEFSRGRWAGMAFTPVGQGKTMLSPKPQSTAPAPVQEVMSVRAQTLGLRFQNVDIPKGTDIKKAFIQFTVDEAKNVEPFKVTITGQAHDNPATFAKAARNVSSRKPTKASVVWKDSPAWTKVGETGPSQQTPNLKPIVKELVQRDGWQAGNAMAFIFKGTGIRTAVSQEGSVRIKKPKTAPTLVVVLASGKILELPVAQSTDDVEEIIDSGAIDNPSTDLEFCWEEPPVLKAASSTPSTSAPAKTLDLKKFFSNPKVRLPDGKGEVSISGERRQWHKVTLTLDGPYAHELDKSPNPFTDLCMTVIFTHRSGSPVYKVPGYFATDGNAAQTGADCGTQWRAHLSPNKTGTWQYQIQFVAGKDVAVSDRTGQPIAAYHGKSGSFKVRKTNKKEPDMRKRGLLQYVGEHYLKFAGTGEYFLKCGADAPENLFAYADFDGPFKVDGHKDNLIKTWEPHVRDWRKGDPTWQNGKGKGLIGAINYLASEGMNVFSFLPMNIAGDDRNVFPYTHYDERYNMDVSRLDQWEIVLAHGTQMGMFLHFKTLETENEMILDNGDLGPQRWLYYRELIARFAHHPALNWNLGEEINTANTAQKKAWAQYLWETDPYQHHIVIHNMGEPHYDLLGPGSALTGFSLQTSNPAFTQVHRRTLDYVTRSAAAGKPWAVACDEPGDATHALLPDKDNPEHRNARVNGLWGCYTAGGWGLEWYFGYQHDHSDLTCQDWRSRDLFWDQCRHALSFFKDTKIPFWQMANADDLVEGDAYCFAKADGPYVVVLKTGGTVTLNLTEAKGKLKTRWFNPRTGTFTKGSSINAGQKVTLGPAPSEPDQDWVVLLD